MDRDRHRRRADDRRDNDRSRRNERSSRRRYVVYLKNKNFFQLSSYTIVIILFIRSRSHKREDDPDRIDKKRLLEIARKNAITMLANGTLPGTQNLPLADKEKILAKMRFGGKSVDELTEFCKKLSKGESAGYLSNVSDDSDHDNDGAEKAFHHPFVLKDRGPIVMNIKVCSHACTPHNIR